MFQDVAFVLPSPHYFAPAAPAAGQSSRVAGRDSDAPSDGGATTGAGTAGAGVADNSCVTADGTAMRIGPGAAGRTGVAGAAPMLADTSGLGSGMGREGTASGAAAAR